MNVQKSQHPTTILRTLMVSVVAFGLTLVLTLDPLLALFAPVGALGLVELIWPSPAEQAARHELEKLYGRLPRVG